MASVMLVDFTAQPVGYAHPVLFRTYWRPGTAGGVTADATDALARVRANLAANPSAFTASCVWTPNPVVKVIEDSTGAITSVLTGTPPATLSGTAGGDINSPAVAWIVNSQTNLVVGRRFLRGRTFLAGSTEGNNDSNGRPTGIGPLAAAFTGMLTGGATTSFPVVWHRPNRSTLVGGTSGPITGYTVNAQRWGIQRRRRP